MISVGSSLFAYLKLCMVGHSFFMMFEIVLLYFRLFCMNMPSNFASVFCSIVLPFIWRWISSCFLCG
jgi:hypothetical protein